MSEEHLRKISLNSTPQPKRKKNLTSLTPVKPSNNDQSFEISSSSEHESTSFIRNFSDEESLTKKKKKNQQSSISSSEEEENNKSQSSKSERQLVLSTNHFQAIVLRQFDAWKNSRRNDYMLVKDFYLSFSEDISSNVPQDNMKEEILEKNLKSMENLWKFDDGFQMSNFHLIPYVIEHNLFLSPTENIHTMSPEDLEIIFDKNVIFVTHRLQLRFTIAGLILSNHPKAQSNETRFQNLYHIQTSAMEIYMNAWIWRQKIIHPDTIISSSSSFGLIRHMPRTISQKLNPFGDLFLFCLLGLQKRGYRKVGNVIYKQILNAKQQKTNAWTPVTECKDGRQKPLTIQRYVDCCVNFDTDFKNVNNLLSSPTICNNVANLLTKNVNSYFPEVCKSRYLFSFQNGIWNFANLTFITFDNLYKSDKSDQELEDIKVFRKYSSANYIDRFFEDQSHIKNWRDIDTPPVEVIAKAQGWERDTIDQYYAVHGRFFYFTTEPFLMKIDATVIHHGVAGTGKSTFLKWLRRMYPIENLGIITNNFETRFGLMSLMDCWAALGPEIKHNFSMNQAEFTQLCETNEVVVINRKHLGADKSVIDFPTFLAMNEFPKWRDSAGSLARRLIAFPYSKIVPKDKLKPDLSQEFYNCSSKLVQKLARAFLEFSNLNKDKEINAPGVLSPQIQEAVHKLMQQSHPLIHFFNDCKTIAILPDTFCKWTDFLEVFNKWAKNTGYKPETIRWTEDFWKSIFDQNNLTCSDSFKNGQYDRWIENLKIIGFDYQSPKT